MTRHFRGNSILILDQLISPTPGRGDSRRDRELDNLISSLVGESRPGSVGPRENGSPARRSRPNSVLSAGQFSNENSDPASPANGGLAQNTQAQLISTSVQTLSTIPLSTIYDFPPSPVKEVFSYSKGVQTTEDWSVTTRQRDILGEEDQFTELNDPVNPKKSSRREREREEELRHELRREIEEELKAARELINDGSTNGIQVASGANYPVRPLTTEEMNAVTSSNDFMEFVERSSKVIERALDQEYDILADYGLNDMQVDDEDDEAANSRGKGRRKIRQVAQFYDERWSKKRMISDIDFSAKFPELVLASYTKNPSAPHDPDGLVQVWNMHLHDRPEFVFNAQSDVLTAKFSPFHPSLIIGGAYSGQVLLWDTRAKSSPVQKTPLTGSGHTHPIYSVEIVGTQNANNSTLR